MVVIVLLPSSKGESCTILQYNARPRKKCTTNPTNYYFGHGFLRSDPNYSNNVNHTNSSSKNYHITKVNISNEYSQTDLDEKPLLNEEEIITKKKTELTTTKVIATRLRRQVKLKNGKFFEDSGPVYETNTTEDVDKVESETTERKTFGDNANDAKAIILNKSGLAEKESSPSSVRGCLLPVRDDGLVKAELESRIVSREDIIDKTEAEHAIINGDFSDEAYVNAICNAKEGDDLSKILLASKEQLQQVEPKVVLHTINKRNTIDTENVDLKYIVQSDGTLVTERKKTTKHEEILDEDLPDNIFADNDGKTLTQKEKKERYSKQREEVEVEYVSDGKVIGKEMKYAAETEQMERDGSKHSDWDSLSDRVKKSRRQKAILQKQQTLAERTDALTKVPLDFNYEEETRKKETNKWLDSHFGSESTSKDSFADSLSDHVEPTKKTFFNVTIKSNQIESDLQNDSYNPAKSFAPEREVRESPTTKAFFQGVSEWSERKASQPQKHLSSPVSKLTPKSFQEELIGTLERKQKLLKQKRDYRRDSRENLLRQKEDLGYLSGSRTDIRNQKHSSDEYIGVKKFSNGFMQREDSGFARESKEDLRIHRDDSAYISSSTYFATPSRIKTSTPPPAPPMPTHLVGKLKLDEQRHRPKVPLRKKRNSIHQQHETRQENVRQQDYVNYPAKPRRLKLEEKIYIEDPVPDYSQTPSRSRSGSPIHRNQKICFSSPPSPTITSSIQTQTLPHKKKTVSSSISNSLRRIVNKFRSASAERKLKIKNKNERSPSPPIKSYFHGVVIDGHIRNDQGDQASTALIKSEQAVEGSGLSDNEQTCSNKIQSDTMISPKQRYYLGENPYGSSLFGKENKYNADSVRQRNFYNIHKDQEIPRQSPVELHNKRTGVTTNSLGRFSRNGMSVPPVNSQTLPRKLDHTKKPISQSTINVSIVNKVSSPANHNIAPAKPARTYKSLERSKSFNIYDVNGQNEPTPIYMEKLTNNNYQRRNIGNSAGYRDHTASGMGRGPNTSTNNVNSMYKSTSHLSDIKLKSPSIVNLISRSTRDLSQIYEIPQSGSSTKNHYIERRYNGTNLNSSKVSPLNGGRESGIGILRQRSNSNDNDNYSETRQYQTMSSDITNPTVTNTIETISKRTVPLNGNVSKEITTTKEVTRKTTSRSPTLKYYDIDNINNSNVNSNSKRVNNGIVIELKNNY